MATIKLSRFDEQKIIDERFGGRVPEPPKTAHADFPAKRFSKPAEDDIDGLIRLTATPEGFKDFDTGTAVTSDGELKPTPAVGSKGEVRLVVMGGRVRPFSTETPGGFVIVRDCVPDAPQKDGPRFFDAECRIPKGTLIIETNDGVFAERAIVDLNELRASAEQSISETRSALAALTLSLNKLKVGI